MRPPVGVVSVPFDQVALAQAGAHDHVHQKGVEVTRNALSRPPTETAPKRASNPPPISGAGVSVNAGLGRASKRPYDMTSLPAGRLSSGCPIRFESRGVVG
jgi:hypothetical protein